MIKVGYRTVWAVSFLVLGAILIVLALLSMMDDRGTPLVVLGPLIMLLGILQFVRPYFLFDPQARTVMVKALLGPMTREFGHRNGDQLSVADNRIMITRSDGRTKKVPVSRNLAKPEDWNAVVAQLG